MSGITSYQAGLAAEDIVAREYEGLGMPVVQTRWRGSGGEIDLIAQNGAGFVFVEVKKSKNHHRAVAHLTPRQIERIYATASEFIADAPNGQNTEVRFDVALVDQSGRVQRLENAIGF